jgi:hypothetical protein
VGDVSWVEVVGGVVLDVPVKPLLPGFVSVCVDVVPGPVCVWVWVDVVPGPVPVCVVVDVELVVGLVCVAVVTVGVVFAGVVLAGVVFAGVVLVRVGSGVVCTGHSLVASASIFAAPAWRLLASVRLTDPSSSTLVWKLEI